WLNWYWALIHFLACWFFYRLAADLGLSRAAATLGAAGFAFGGVIGTVAWIDVINGAIWAPLVFLYVLRCGRGVWPWRNCAVGGLFLGISWLSGHHELPILISMAAAVTWLWLCWRDRRLVRYAVPFFAVAMLIAAAQALPTYEFGRLSRRWVGVGDSL